MVKRLVAAVLLAVALCACQESKPTNNLITGATNVKIDEARYVSSAEGGQGIDSGTVTYIVVKLELTNDTSSPFSPQIEHFNLVDASFDRIAAIDQGSSALTGISNDLSPLKPGDKRTFVMGFRASPQVTGQILYAY